MATNSADQSRPFLDLSGFTFDGADYTVISFAESVDQETRLYVDAVLVPTLRPGIRDNLRSHKEQSRPPRHQAGRDPPFIAWMMVLYAL